MNQLAICSNSEYKDKYESTVNVASKNFFSGDKFATTEHQNTEHQNRNTLITLVICKYKA